MPCACQNRKKFEVVVTQIDPKTQQPKERVVHSSQHKSVADGVAKRYAKGASGTVEVREVDPKNAKK
ncbi:hypothetical protein [Streptomyces sp. CRB46]|uniref:hypothetical protein n=1 Tax=Streptomyces sp. CRB46 TaxID=2682613 RepID=UPI0018F377FD|nr:hypothetical protein [Streptomyces sp. CRB46]